MPDVALEDLAVHQLCALAARRKAFVRLADATPTGGRKRDDRLAGQIIALKERIDNRRRNVPPDREANKDCVVVLMLSRFTAIPGREAGLFISIVLRAFLSIQFRSASV